MDGFCNGAKVADDLHELISEARVGVVARHHPPGRGTASRLSRVRRRPAASPAPATVGDPPRSLARAGEGSEKWAFVGGALLLGHLRVVCKTGRGQGPVYIPHLFVEFQYLNHNIGNLVPLPNLRNRVKLGHIAVWMTSFADWVNSPH